MLYSIMRFDRRAVRSCITCAVVSGAAILALASAPGYGEGTAADAGFLIVAPEAFHKTLTDYVAHKSEQLPTTLVSLESILFDSEGVDDAEKLKRYIFDAWSNDGVGYVLLVGDADVLPVRYMVLDRITPAAFDYAFYPSDLYYSDLARPDGSFESWNASDDDFHAGYFGEVRGEKNKDDAINFDDIDYIPDIAVGRWPVSTAEEAAIVAAKTVTYEVGLQSASKEGARRAALFSVGGWVDSRPVLDEVATTLPEHLTVDRLYFADGFRNDETPAPDWNELSARLNEGLGFVFHAGHGSDDSWHDCFPLHQLGEVDNGDRLPIMISAGCSTARMAALPPYEAYIDVDGGEHIGTDFGEVFDAPPTPPACYQTGQYNRTGLGEQLLKGGANGAVAYIGCNTGSQPCGLTLLRGMATELANPERRRLGDCWSGAVAFYHREEALADLVPNDDWYPASIYFQGMKFMLFGDPTLMLPSAD